MKALLYGNKNFSDTVEELAIICGYDVVARIDDYKPCPPYSYSITQAKECFSPHDYSVIMAIGYNNLAARLKAFATIKEMGYFLPVLVHPTAYVSPSATIKAGTMLMAQSCVDCRSTIDEACVLWPKATINHDCMVGMNTFISPSVTVCGNVTIGTSVFIGASAVIVDGTSIPSGYFMKMGTSYTKRGR